MNSSPKRWHVVVSAPPASRKSTLATALAAELGLPPLAKDRFKDALMDSLGAPDLDASRRLGAAALATLLAVARDCPATVLESVWYRSRAANDLTQLGAPIVEVFCRCERGVAAQRYMARRYSPGRALRPPPPT
jgi:predicted kinase